MTIKEIDLLEEKKGDDSEILLFKEGIFMKLYNMSAYLFHRYIKSYKVKNIYYKSTDKTYLSIGFPSEILPKLLEENNLSIIREKGYFSIKDKMLSVDTQKYKEFENKYQESETITRSNTNIKVESMDNKLINAENNLVVQHLRAFNLASSTPMECMLFLNQLKEKFC